jgi:ABC-type uncharacterized transport system ATPase subunit
MSVSEVAISLQNLWKCFKRYEHPADRLKEIFFPKRCKSQEFWAVKGINLEIYKGQTLGIIGRNGSGKSTLLQMIAGTMTPTWVVCRCGVGFRHCWNWAVVLILNLRADRMYFLMVACWGSVKTS